MKKKHKKLFTLIELLIVISIIAILASMLLPALRSARDKAKEIDCKGRMKQFGTAFVMYANDYNSFLPAPGDNANYDGTYAVHSWWYIFIGPYVGNKQWTPGEDPTPWPKSKTLFWCPSTDLSLPGMNNPYSGTIAGYGMNRFMPPVENSTDYKEQLRNYPMTQRINKPSEKLLVADSRLTVSMGAYGDITSGDPEREYKFDRMRHRRGANTLYVDGHVYWMPNMEVLSRAANKTLY